jgi:hypothetical protein
MDFLLGPEEEFIMVKKFIDERQSKALQETRTKALRIEGDELWRKRDYESFVMLYEADQFSLNSLQLKQLQYAKKHCK